MNAIRRLSSIIVLLSFLLVAASLAGYTGIADWNLVALKCVASAFPYLLVASLILSVLRKILLGSRA